MATIYLKGGTEHTLILGTRQAVVYPFSAPSWTDLRLGMYLSVTKASADDDITGLAETIANASLAKDLVWIGFKNNSDDMPRVSGVPFCGVSNTLQGAESASDSRVDTSDAGTGTTNAGYWRVGRGGSPLQFGLLDGNTLRVILGGSNYFHMPQDVSITGGYAALLLIKLTRSTGTDTTITPRTYVGTTKIDESFSSTPTIDAIRSKFNSVTFSTFGSTSGVVANVPDAVYAYWPFYNSRLRIHAVVLEKFA